MDPALLQRAMEHADMVSAALHHSLSQAGWLSALGISFLAGLAFNFNPVTLAVMPTSLAYVTKTRDTRQVFLLGGMLLAGFLIAHVLLGVTAGLGGLGVKHLIGRFWGVIIGPLLILLGLSWTGWVRIPFLSAAFCRTGESDNALPMTLGSAFGMGVIFSVAVCPFCTPALVILLGMATASASPFFGGGLLLAFALGRALPIAAGFGAMGGFQRLKIFSRYRRPIEIAGGLALVLMGLYMLNTYFFVIPSLAA